jgi:hypothetical protein
MVVKDREELVTALDRAEATLRQVSSDLERTKASVIELEESPGITVGELVGNFNVSEEAVVVFVRTAGELLGDRSLSVQSARRAALLAAADGAWEDELGPLLSSAQVRELLGGVSRQRIDELLRSRRLIGLRDSAARRRRFPAFQFRDGRPLQALVDAYWTIAGPASSEWTAASWCVSPDEALAGDSPARWARDGRDSARLAVLAPHDAARLAQ